MGDERLRGLTHKVVYGVLLARWSPDLARTHAPGVAEALLIKAEGAGAPPTMRWVAAEARFESQNRPHAPAGIFAGLTEQQRELAAWGLVCRLTPDEIASCAELLVQHVVTELEAIRLKLQATRSAWQLEAAFESLAPEPPGAELQRPPTSSGGDAPGGTYFTLRAPLEYRQGLEAQATAKEQKTDPSGERAVDEPTGPVPKVGDELTGPASLAVPTRPAPEVDTGPTPAVGGDLDLTVPLGKAINLLEVPTTPPKEKPGAELDATGKVPLPLALREVEPPRAERSPDDSWRVPGNFTTKRVKGFGPIGQLEVVVVPPGQIHRGWRPFALFGALAILGLGSGWTVVAKADRLSNVKLAPALAVRTPLKAGTRVLPEMLVEVKLPVELARSIVPPDQVALIAMQPLQVNVEGGEPLRWWQFQVAHGPEDLSQRVNMDYRAFALEVGEKSAVGFHVKPGDRVDVVAVLTPGTDPSQRTAFIAAQNVTVLVTGGPHPVPGLQGAYSDLSVLVSPTDAERLALVRAKGKFAFMLRGPNDFDSIDGVKLNSTGLLELELKGGVKPR